MGTNFSAILIKIQSFLFKRMHLKMLYTESSPEWWPFCLCLNVVYFSLYLLTAIPPMPPIMPVKEVGWLGRCCWFWCRSNRTPMGYSSNSGGSPWRGVITWGKKDYSINSWISLIIPNYTKYFITIYIHIFFETHMFIARVKKIPSSCTKPTETEIFWPKIFKNIVLSMIKFSFKTEKFHSY